MPTTAPSPDRTPGKFPAKKGLPVENRKPFVLLSENAGARTQDLRIKSPLLYQLSYVPSTTPEALAPKFDFQKVTKKSASTSPDGVIAPAEPKILGNVFKEYRLQGKVHLVLAKISM